MGTITTKAHDSKRRGRVALGLLLLTLPTACQSFSLTSRTTMAPHLVRLGQPRSVFKSSISMSSEVEDEFRQKKEPRSSPESIDKVVDPETTTSPMQNWLSALQENLDSFPGKMPPIQVDDANILFYDVFLIINLTVSISFWVVHRLQFDFLWDAFSEGCLMSLLWIGSGLYSGAFLHSAVDGHYGAQDERGGPKAAGLLGFHTFLNAINLRLVVALFLAILEHRPVGSIASEQLIPLEIGFGLILMSAWRTVHSSFVPRL